MIEASNLSRIPSVRHGFFTRQGGYSQGLYASLNCSFGSGDDAGTVVRNRDHIATVLGLTGDRLVVPRQVHSPDVVTVEAPWPRDDAPEADAAVTATPNIAIAITTADCAPVLFADEAAGVIGAAHAGWRGALAGVTEATVAAMERLGARRETISASVGPSISKPNSEVGPELREAFVDAHRRAERFFAPSAREDHFRFDLPGYLHWRLEHAGIGSIEIIECCTYANEERFFSFRRTTHRAEKIYGCQLSAVTLGPDTFLRED